MSLRLDIISELIKEKLPRSNLLFNVKSSYHSNSLSCISKVQYILLLLIKV